MLFTRIGLGVLCAFLALGWPARADEGAAPVRYDDWHVVRAYVRSAEQIEQLNVIGARLLSEAEGFGPVEYAVPPQALSALAGLDMKFDVLSTNLQAAIDAEREYIELHDTQELRGSDWFAAYKTYDQIVAKLNQMAVDKPNLVTLINIGSSVQSRPIWGVRIKGVGTNQPAVLYNGTQHAREWIAPMMTMWIADQLVYGYDSDPQIRSLVDRVEFLIVPVVNPDGYVYTWQTDRLWRKNRRLNAGGCYGVDNNRNWGVAWGGPGSSSDPCSETYRGTAAFSEPETQALRDLYLANPHIVSSIDFHSYGQYILSPYGYTTALPADHATFMELNLAMRNAIFAVYGMNYTYGPVYSTLYQVSGGSIDWCYDVARAFAFVIELRPATAGGGGFQLPAAQIIPTCQENFAAVRYLSEWSASPVKISFPNGLPGRLEPAVPTDVTVQIFAVGATLDPASPRLFSRQGATGPFTSQTLTPLGNNLYRATLPATACGRTLQYYFSAATTTGVPGTAPPDAPTNVYQVTAVPIVTMLNATMDTNPGWSTEGLWAWGRPTGQGGSSGRPDPAAGYTGLNAYGYNLNGDYENNLPERHLTTTAINCTGRTGVRLSFWRWLGVEQFTYDRAYVRVSNNGTTWTNVWQNGTVSMTGGTWEYCEYDISAVADNRPTVFIRWTMGTTDASVRYCGWNIDDVKVWALTTCPYQPGDLNCDGAVNTFDIDAFVLALTNPSGYQSAYPNCDRNLADCNQDGQINAFDIDPFVRLITP